MDNTKYKELPFVTNYKNPLTYIGIINRNLNIKTKVEVKYTPLIVNVGGVVGCVFGQSANSSKTSYIIRGDGRFVYGLNNIISNINVLQVGKYYDIIADGLNDKLIINGTEYSNKSIYDVEINDFFIFIINGSIAGTQSKNVHKWFGCKIWLDGTNLSYDFVPCKRIEDGKIGVYDKVKDKFYTPNVGSLEEPFDFSQVTSIQIPEGNVVKIEDKDNILWKRNDYSLPNFVGYKATNVSINKDSTFKQLMIDNINANGKIVVPKESIPAGDYALTITGLDPDDTTDTVVIAKTGGSTTITSNGTVTISFTDNVDRVITFGKTGSRSVPITLKIKYGSF